MQNKFTFVQSQLEDIDYKKQLLMLWCDVNTIADNKLPIFSDQYLNSKEQEIFDQRKKIRAKKEYLASRFLIKTVAAFWYQKNFHQLTVIFDPKINQLRVFCQQKLLPCSISLSHSKGVVLLAMSLTIRKIGVDIEYIDNTRNIEKLTQHFFHPQEQRLISLQGVLAFYQLWTQKEALAKMSGQSLMSILTHNLSQSYSHAYFYTQVHKNFMVTLASSISSNELTVFQCNTPLHD